MDKRLPSFSCTYLLDVFFWGGFCSSVLTATFGLLFCQTLPILLQGRTLEDMEDKLAIERLHKKWPGKHVSRAREYSVWIPTAWQSNVINANVLAYPANFSGLQGSLILTIPAQIIVLGLHRKPVPRRRRIDVIHSEICKVWVLRTLVVNDPNFVMFHHFKHDDALVQQVVASSFLLQNTWRYRMLKAGQGNAFRGKNEVTHHS